MPNKINTENAAPEYKYAVCCWSTPKNTSIQDIEQCAAIGAQAVGLWERKFAPDEDGAIEDALAKYKIRAGIVLPSNWTIFPVPLNPEAASLTWKDLCTTMVKSIHRLARLKPVGVLVGPGVSGDPAKPLRATPKIIEGLKMVADAAGEVGLRIAFEPYARRRGAALVTLTETVEVIEKAGRSNVDLLPDVWHFWPEENVHKELRQFVDRIIGIQVNDVRVEERSWCDRVQPGQGRNQCTGMVATLIDAGFKGWYDYEVFSDDGRWGNAYPDSLWHKPHQEFLREGHECFSRVHAEAEKMVKEKRLPK
jgi:sugar phosphate isomerase/epimerase